MRVQILRKKRDFYTKKAKREGYRSRAAYKLLQIDKKYKIFQPGQLVIDLCGAPGGFSQIARDRTKETATIFLVDLARIKPIPGITKVLKGDITSQSTILQLQQEVERYLKPSLELVVLADCSPNVSGNWVTDHARQIWLSEVALGIANYFLADKFLTKVFQGELFKSFINKIRIYYKEVRIYKPSTSRKTSAETYIVGEKRLDLNISRFNPESLFKGE